jgi:hypothetical protein
MLFFKALLTCALAIAPVLADISVLSPDADHYWVFGTNNSVTWNYKSGDPEQVTVVIHNSNDNTLHGDFDIAEYVPVSQKSVEITEVTLKPASGYSVLFVNPKNHSQVYATGPEFEVKPKGTKPVAAATGSVDNGGGSSANSTSSGAAPSSSSAANGASSAFAPHWTLVSTIVGAAVAGALSLSV